MGTVMAIMAGYYVLNGQAFRALGEVAEWMQKKLPTPLDTKQDSNE